MEVRIGLYTWNVSLVPKEEINGSDGITRLDDFSILIRDDLEPRARNIALTHEIVHAILNTQGRTFQKKFDVEEVCEFIAWELPEIYDVVTNIIRVFEYGED